MNKFIFLCLLVVSQNLMPISFSFTVLKNNVDTATKKIEINPIKTLCVAGSIYLIYKYGEKAFKSLKNKIEYRIENRFLNAIKLQFKPNPNCTDSELKEKAWFINIRKCLIERLEQIDPSDNMWSENFDHELSKYKKAFDLFDNARNKVFDVVKFLANPYEHEYQKTYDELNIYDKLIIDNLVKNILLKYKPDILCSQDELFKKAQMKIESKKFNNVIISDLEKMILPKIAKAAANSLIYFVF